MFAFLGKDAADNLQYCDMEYSDLLRVFSLKSIKNFSINSFSVFSDSERLNPILCEGKMASSRTDYLTYLCFFCPTMLSLGFQRKRYL